MLRCCVVASLAACAGVLAGCGSNEPAEGRKVQVSIKPSAACNAIEARRRLGAEPPNIGFLIQNNDVSNFSGSTSASCNERQLIYSAPALDVPARERRGVFVRLTFPGNINGAARLLFTDPNVTRLAGRKVVSGGGSGSKSAALRVGPAIVTTVVACAKPPDPLTATACAREAGLEDLLVTVLRELLPALEERLR